MVLALLTPSLAGRALVALGRRPEERHHRIRPEGRERLLRRRKARREEREHDREAPHGASIAAMRLARALEAIHSTRSKPSRNAPWEVMATE